MSKLFKLKEWLTLDEAASHISNLLGEPATVADLYRFALDGHLTISVDFVNFTDARLGQWVTTDEVKFRILEYDLLTGEKIPIPISLPMQHEVRVSENNWIRLQKEVVSIGGVWDLPLVGAEIIDLEYRYQKLTSGLEVTLTSLDGVFVQKDDVICQLQTDYEENEYQKGSLASGREMERYIASNVLRAEHIRELRDKHEAERLEYLAERKKKRKEENYFPSGGLDEHDHVLVVRTNELTRFILSLEDNPITEKPLSSRERNTLLVLIAALCNEVGIDPSKRGVTSSIEKMTEIIGAPLSDDTIRKILSQLKDAVTTRNT